MKCKNGQIETVGDSCESVDPQVWKSHEEEETSRKACKRVR
jgi:hypothetical protein